MATFQVNPGYDSETTVEAVRYAQVGKFFDFYDAEDNVVATFEQARIFEIRRSPEAN